jgi:ribokinase
MAKVISVGSLNVDITFSVAAFPQPGEDKPVRDSWRTMGGKALNQAVAAHRAGATACLVGAVGDDSLGRDVLGFLRDEGVSTDGCAVLAEMPTGLALILVEPSARNTILFEPGAARGMSWPASVNVEAGDCVLSHAEIPMEVLTAAYEAGREAGAFNVISGMRADQADKLLPLLDLLIVNQLEFEILAGQPVPAKVLVSGDLRPLAERAGIDSVAIIVTLGELGARYLDTEGGSAYVAAPAVDAVDTTAAGDVFTGALAADLTSGGRLPDAIGFAVAAGSLAVLRKGASSAAPRRREIAALVREARLAP